ncbi:MAG: type II secretion system F family protein [Oscillospiraceae bacterium]|nr:type II secretion system F family protein [Oscillospiraceae bacterium]
MPNFSYVAIDLQNNKIKSSALAKDEIELRKLLSEQKLVLIKHKDTGMSKRGVRLKSRDCAEFSRRLAGMLSSGITAVRALEILMDDEGTKPTVRALYERLYRDVNKGSTLSDGMRMQSGSFPDLLINMYASGEASGKLDFVAEKMAVHYDKESNLNSKITSAMIYPAVLLSATIVVVFLLFTFMLPGIFNMFEDMELPFVTRIMMAVSDFMRTQWLWVLIGVLSAIAAFQICLKNHGFVVRFDKFKLRIPGLGRLLKTIFTARFARTLSSLYSSGIPMLSALEISSSVIGNKYIEDQFSSVIKDVRNGRPLSESVRKVDGFNRKLSSTILIGEESGRLDAMLESTADTFDHDADAASMSIVQLMQPVMIIIMAVVVLIVMLSVFLPLMTFYQTMGNNI